MSMLRTKILLGLVAIEGLIVASQFIMMQKQYSETLSKDGMTLMINAGSTISALGILCLSKYITRNTRQTFLKNISYALTAIFIFTAISISLQGMAFIYITWSFRFAQNICQAGFFTVILSIFAIQNRELAGFYLAAQSITIIGSIIIGLIIAVLMSDTVLKVFYCFYICVFLVYSLYIFLKVQEIRYEEQTQADDALQPIPWRNIISSKVLRLDSGAIAIFYGMVKEMATILMPKLESMSPEFILLCVLILIVLYPVAVTTIYKFLRPINNRCYVFVALVLEATSLGLFSIFCSQEENYYVTFIIGLILIIIAFTMFIVAALPDMLDSVNQSMPDIEFPRICDRVCSLVYPIGAIGELVCGVVLAVFGEVFGMDYAVGACALSVMLFAFYYETETKALRGLIGARRIGENLDLYIVGNDSVSKEGDGSVVELS